MSVPPDYWCLRYLGASPEISGLAVMLYVRFPLSLCNFEDLLHERSADIGHKTVLFRWHRFGPMFVAEIRKRRGGTGALKDPVLPAFARSGKHA